MKSQFYLMRTVKFAMSIILFGVFFVSFAQTSPNITRLIQQNTLKGSRISIVETTNDYTYHIGTINSSEVGFDNLSATNVGLDDLFVLKSNNSNGINSWFKTINAGTKGTISPKYVYIDSAENVYVFAQFKGSMSLGGKTISSVSSTDAFLMKIDKNGNGQWVNYLENGYNSSVKVKLVSDGTNDYFVYAGNHLLKLNSSNGEIIYDKIYESVELKSIALKNNDLYLAGYSKAAGTIIGTEVITQSNIGFVLKGDVNANIVASLKTTPADTGFISSDISDIAISGDGFLLVSGFYTNKSINLVTETGNISFSYNPNSNYVNTRLFNFVAKVDLNLANVSFFRSSTAINQEGGYSILTYRNSTRLVPYGNNGDFNQVLYIADRFKNFSSYTNTNGSVTSFTPNTDIEEYTLVTSNNNAGNYSSGAQPLNYGIRTSTNGSYFTQTNSNVRVFTSGLFNSQTSNSLWTKQKSTSIGGSYSQTFIKHLNSQNSDLFLTTLIEGKADFFGRQVSNGTGNYSRYFARIGADGISKWIAKFDSASNVDKTNVSQNYTVVDKYDNLYVFCGKSAALSVFTDALGNSFSFGQNAGLDEKVLIKLDKNGKLIWSKQISGCEFSALSVDLNSNIYLTGISGDIKIDGNIAVVGSSSFFILKFNEAGGLLYSKKYTNSISNAYSVIPVIDKQNNFYIFSEPMNGSEAIYNFGNIVIPSNDAHLDLLMLKFDDNGNATFGKNFFANAPEYNYAWPNDVKFDGEDFVMMGNLLGEPNKNYTGLDLVTIPQVYANNYYPPFLAKIRTDGNVLWQKSIDSNSSNVGNYTNINVDENKDIYMFYYVKDKVSFNGNEYSFDNLKGNKVLLKINSNGNLNYFKTIDLSIASYPIIDVIENDKVNVASFTVENSILNYPINNANASNLYIATFGDLDQKYLTPKKNYLLLTDASITNNPSDANEFEFDLVNNVNWTGVSDQNWLGLSFTQSSDGKNISNNISGKGDAKIFLKAETNTSGEGRTASVLFNGDEGVPSKTVVVSQTGVLGAHESKTYITVIYPNPTNDILNIKTERKISKIEIFDMNGKLCKSNTGNININVSTLTKGMYVIKIYTDGDIINSKFIKN